MSGRRVTTFALMFFVASAAAGLADEANSAESSAHVSVDPVELRRKSNERYVGVPIHTRVTQRFEMYDPHSEEALRELKEMGFTQVILDWPQLHKAATDLDLNVVLANWWIDKTKQEDIDRGLDWAKKVDREKLIGFSVMDEPGRNAPDTPFGFYIELYEKLKPEFRADFPNTRLEISHWGPMASWDDRYYDYFSYLYEAADVMRIMPYPDLYEGPLDDVFFMMQRSRRMMEIAQRELPLVVILQAWLLPLDGKLPTIPELRVMAYQAMLSGAETVSFFEYNEEIWAKTPGFKEQFCELMKEVTAFSRRYRNCEVETLIDSKGVLKASLRSPKGTETTVHINTRREPVGEFAALEVQVSSTPLESDTVVPWATASITPAYCSTSCQISCCRRQGKKRRVIRRMQRAVRCR